MRIALYGYGKMGAAIEQVAMERGHSVSLKVTSSNAGTTPKGTDVVIEFSRPELAVSNMELCLKNGVPVVVGTTGWYDALDQVKDMVREHQGALLYASNFSIGVNLFFQLNKRLSSLMDKQPQYSALLEETHHIHKVDAPSGTALTLARDTILQVERYKQWAMREDAKVGDLPIHSIRKDEVPGTHRMEWRSHEDRITLEHEAFGRSGFALGAVLAAEWLIQPLEKGTTRKGVFTFADVLDLT